MVRQNKTTFEECNEMLEDVLTQIQDFREEFTSTLDDIEDMITSAMNAEVSGLCPDPSMPEARKREAPFPKDKDVLRALCQETFAA